MTIKVTLGGQEYDVAMLPYRPAKEWRGRLNEPFNEILSMLAQVEKMDIQNIQDMVAVVRSIVPVVIRAPDIVFDLLLAYSSTLEQDRERIETTAYDHEIVAGFVEVLKMAFPLGTLKQFLGPQEPGTSKSSPVLRGRAARPTPAS